LEKYTWPGNVRQLENVLLYAAVSAQDGVIEVCDLPEQVFARGAEDLTGAERAVSALDELEKNAITNALRAADNNVRLAAEALGMPRTTLYRKLRRLGLRN
jgi:transcriptional regulator of acetoin/glycerol metabolism